MKYTSFPQVNNNLWITLCKLGGYIPIYLWITSIDGSIFFNIIGEYAVFGHNYIEKEDFHYENDISAKEETAF